MRFKGLRFSFPLRKGEACLFVLPKESRFFSGVDMLFVFFPLDIVWLDSNKKVVDFRKMKPFCGVAYPKRKAKYVIEFPAGEGEFKIGEKLIF